MAVDYSLYLVTDRILVGPKDFLLSIRKALEGGVTLLQLREKETNSREFYDIGVKVKELAAEFGVPLIINDRVTWPWPWMPTGCMWANRICPSPKSGI